MNITLSRSKPKQAETSLEFSTISPPLGSFDLSGDAFGRAERLRRILTGVSLGTAVALTGLILLGVGASIETDSATTERARSEQQQAAVLADLNKLDQAEGYPAEALLRHITPRQDVLVSAIGGEYDYSGLITALQQAAPAGVNISSITFAESAAAPAAPAPDTTGAGTDPAAEAAPPGPPPQTVSVNATGPLNMLLPFTQAVGRIPGLAPMGSPMVTDSGDGLSSITFSTALTDAALSKRATALQSSDAQGQPTGAPAQTGPSGPTLEGSTTPTAPIGGQQ